MSNKTTAAKTVKDATATVEVFAADAQKTVTEQVEKLTKGFEDVAAFSQQNVDAIVKSSEIAAKAAEGINNEVASFSKKTFEESVAAAKELAASKNVTELFEKQTAFAQAAFEGFVAQATKLNEIYTSAAKDIAAPLSERVTAATEAVKSYSA
ncbi:MAG TPA: phasin family protein [Paracoccaceae bacterium]|nr:phasin family protein [Paracoccaceae bacterium]